MIIGSSSSATANIEVVECGVLDTVVAVVGSVSTTALVEVVESGIVDTIVAVVGGGSVVN